MKPSFNFLPVFACVLLAGLWLGACRENPRQADTVESEASPILTQKDESSDERITAIQREIEAGKQNIQDIEAFVEMERAKLKENPDYDSSFLEEALHEQQEIRKSVESGEKSLKELAPVKE